MPSNIQNFLHTDPNLPQLQPVCGCQIFRSAISANGVTAMK